MGSDRNGPGLGRRLRAQLRRLGGRRRASQDRARNERRSWGLKYASGDHIRTRWYLEHAPPQLVALIESGVVPDGRGVDIGCGPGFATAYLESRLGACIGLDIAEDAGPIVRQSAEEFGVVPKFLVAQAPAVPLATASVTFVFDRGCMHRLPQEAWPAHLREIERILEPGGCAQLLENSTLQDSFDRDCPPGLEVESVTPFVIAHEGAEHPMVNAVLSKR